MNCRKCRDEIERYLDNELAQGERAIVEQHLAACAECRERLKELQALGSMLRAQPRVEPGPEYLTSFNDRFWREVKRRRRMRSVEPERRLLPVFWTRIGTVAAAALLLIAVGLVGYRSWHTFFEHPTTALAQPAPEVIPAPEATGKTVEPKPVYRAAEPGTPKAEQQSEGAKTARARMEPAPKPSPAPVAMPAQLPRAQVQDKAEGSKGRGLADRIIEALRTEVSIDSAESQASQAGARKGGLKTAEQKGGVKSGPAPGQEVGGVSAQVLDTVTYPEDALSVKPVLVSIPDASDDDRTKYPNLEVPVWVVVEKDGSVSRAESRSVTANAGLTSVALALARQAQFTPGKRAGNAVRVGKTIVVRIKALKQKDD
jgi:anti-sigma factor RsiW